MTEVKGDFFYSDIIDVQPEKFITYFQKLITLGSRRYLLELKDLTVYGKADDLKNEAPLSTLLKNGTPFMDAVAFLSYDKPPTDIMKDPATSTASEKSNATFIKCAKALYFFYFMYLVRGNSGKDEDDIKSPIVPAFLTNIMGFAGKIANVRMVIASFDLNKIPATWIKLITIKDLGNETKQRFGLTVAGHRMLKPFMYFEPKGTKAAEYKEQFIAVKEFAMRGPTWDVHSITRTAKVATKLGPLNANLGNLMLEVFSEEQLNEMKNNRLIYAIPRRAYGFNDYTNYNKSTFEEFKDFIFKKEE